MAIFWSWPTQPAKTNFHCYFILFGLWNWELNIPRALVFYFFATKFLVVSIRYFSFVSFLLLSWNNYTERSINFIFFMYIIIYSYSYIPNIFLVLIILLLEMSLFNLSIDLHSQIHQAVSMVIVIVVFFFGCGGFFVFLFFFSVHVHNMETRGFLASCLTFHVWAEGLFARLNGLQASRRLSCLCLSSHL